MSELDKEYEASLKSIETENKIDRIFYRPIGFRIARMLRGTGITPNMITVRIGSLPWRSYPVCLI